MFANAQWPVDCQLQPLQHQQWQVVAKQKGLMFVHNVQETVLFLVAMTPQNHMVPGLTLRLAPKHWGVLILNENEAVNFHCVQSTEGAEQRLPCRHMLKVCYQPHTKLAPNKQTIFWGPSNEDLATVNEELIVQEIIKK